MTRWQTTSEHERESLRSPVRITDACNLSDDNNFINGAGIGSTYSLHEERPDLGRGESTSVLPEASAMPAGSSPFSRGIMDDDSDLGDDKPRKRRTMPRWWTNALSLIKGGPRVYEGERTIYINRGEMNAQSKFLNNSISTSKYNLITFLPKFLAGEPSHRGALA